MIEERPEDRARLARRCRRSGCGSFEGLHPKIRGPIVPEAAFDAARAARDEYRAAQAKGSGAR